MLAVAASERFLEAARAGQGRAGGRRACTAAVLGATRAASLVFSRPGRRVVAAEAHTRPGARQYTALTEASGCHDAGRA